MKSNYKLLGNYIREVNERNKELRDLVLLGVSISKEFIPSIANIIGTDMSTYKIVKRNQFAYGPVTSRNGDKISIALLDSYDEALISQSYKSFEIIDENELMPEYLMMWFRRPEFDRYARYMSHGSTRETFDWSEMCNIELPVPSIEKQKEIVKEYKVLQKRINLNNTLIEKLEDTAQAIYKQWFVDDMNDKLEIMTLSNMCSLITDGKHGDCQNEENSGYYFVSVKDLSNGEIIYDNARQITKRDFDETHKRTNLSAGDILLTNSGTIGRMVIVKDAPETNKTTFQKSVAILKPKYDVAPTYYLYSLLKSEIKNISDLAGGSTQSNLLLGDLRNYEINYPGKDIVYKFNEKVYPIFTMIGLKGNELKKLYLMKSILLSKLSTVEG